jgi:hypothetical protein
MNADRFDGPYSNLCDAHPAAAPDGGSVVYSQAQVVLFCIFWDVLWMGLAHALCCSLLEAS